MVKKTHTSSSYLIFQKGRRVIEVNIKDIKKIYKIQKRKLPKIPKFNIDNNFFGSENLNKLELLLNEDTLG